MQLHWFEWAYLGACGVMSLVSFIRYAIDKQRAINANPRRLSESSLHLGDLLGGYPGGLLARRLFRHKTRKLSFRLTAALIIAAHLGVVGWWLWHR